MRDAAGRFASDEGIPIEERFWPKVARGGPDECWEWKAALRYAPPRQRGAFCVGNRKVVDAHRVAWMLTRGEIPAGLQVCHHCDNTLCVNPNHLFLGTQQENMEDMARKGRRRSLVLQGEAHGMAKLSVEDVRAIRDSAESGMSLSRRYNVTDVLIGKIRRRELWRHIP